jgi:hypothetical protein
LSLLGSIDEHPCLVAVARRGLRPKPLPTDYWIKTFLPAQVVSGGIDTTVSDTHDAGPFNMLAAPFASGFFVGDYEGMTAVGTSFHTFLSQVNCSDFSCAQTLTSNRTDIYTSST